jgi:hypothetical protein
MLIIHSNKELEIGKTYHGQNRMLDEYGKWHNDVTIKILSKSNLEEFINYLRKENIEYHDYYETGSYFYKASMD